ncbi:heme ABC transporter ATP-binding protein [Ruixingdingia sedimenti]|uniref:Heme ABC transporter ATP-binding protein n=1 Tax=Ruixingdingia sedimenti TaxID=3073604 RepID=A0ABU1F5N3_9RHOB|nr:heme ABC transporter ATP-binding protein [Xinfangfangia sp. LG-4]MDR5652181.1 heme ABC transporter ATP-binding protein [Xinfangfangia sp. LG-4]
MLAVTDLTVHLGGRRILDALSMQAQAGAVTVILGPNGSGKTTLLRAATGDLRYAGSVRLGGVEIAGAPLWRLAAVRGVLEQATPVAFAFTVAEVVRFGLGAGLSAGRAEVARLALEEVGLADLAERPFHELSGGQQQRVHLARVRAQVWEPVSPEGPRWLFLDEPVASLDIAHQLAVMEVMRGFARAGGGVVAVMHDLNLSAMVADRIVLLAEGRVVAAGPPEAVIRDAPLSRAYGCPLRANRAPAAGPWILPQGAAAS